MGRRRARSRSAVGLMAGACSSLLLFLLFLARASAATQAAMPYAADYEEAPAKQPLDDDPNGYYEDDDTTTPLNAGFYDEYEDYAAAEEEEGSGDYASLVTGRDDGRTGRDSGRRAPPPPPRNEADVCKGSERPSSSSLPTGLPDCDVRAEGFDTAGNRRLRQLGGLDGVYAMSGCHNGRPLYRRRWRKEQGERRRRRRRSGQRLLREEEKEQEDAADPRVLWYSPDFGDWGISNGTEPTEADLLAFGRGGGAGAGDANAAATPRMPLPLFAARWHLGLDLADPSSPSVRGTPDDDRLDDFVPVQGARVVCADGRTAEGAPTPTPVLAASRPAEGGGGLIAAASIIPQLPRVSVGFATSLLVVGVLAVAALQAWASARRGRFRAAGGPRPASAMAGAAAGGARYSELPSADNGGAGDVALVTMYDRSRKREAGHEL